MPRSGTLVICVQNLDFSGANQVILNIVSGRMHESNLVVLSPKVGTFAARFVESGAAVRIGVLEDLLNEIRDVFCIICNTIMTANIVVEMSERPHPVVWILHEWWDDEMIEENLKIRNFQGLTLATVKLALEKAAMVVCVCEAQRRLYNPSAPSSVIYVGVPDPKVRLESCTSTDTNNDSAQVQLDSTSALKTKTTQSLLGNVYCSQPPKQQRPFTFLCLGIVCPRKNQCWTIQLFKKFAADKGESVRLLIVGARYTRVYEIDYLDLVKQEMQGDARIELYDVTDDVDRFYAQADCLILTSLNEVTPMVIPEALSWRIPVLSTNIAGIAEIFEDGKEGFHFAPGDEDRAIRGMEQIYSNRTLHAQMKDAARRRFEQSFDLDIMVDEYRKLVIRVAPPTVLLDMDGALINWDKRFYECWGARGPCDRSRSYFMEYCVEPNQIRDAENIFQSRGFFESLEPMKGALEALREMEEDGLKVYICSAPLKSSRYCAQEKLNWIQKHLGIAWLDKVILCQDKTMVAGDILIDDKPYEYLSPGGKHTTATWKQIIFDQPYNRQIRLPRMFCWSEWRKFVYPMLSEHLPSELLDRSKCDEQTIDADMARGISLSEDEEETRGTSYHPPSIVVPKRNILFQASSLSPVSSEEVQKYQDLLHSSDTPLAPEEIASIVSGTCSLVEDNYSEDIRDYEAMVVISENIVDTSGDSKRQQRNSSDAYMNKLKFLHDQYAERNAVYKKNKDSVEKQLVMNIDEEEVEGLQLFRHSYSSWKTAVAIHSPGDPDTALGPLQSSARVCIPSKSKSNMPDKI